MSGAETSRTVLRGRGRPIALQLAMLAALGLFMAIVGPYGTLAAPPGIRLIYWLLAILGGGLIGILIDSLPPVRARAHPGRLLLVVLLMTPFVALLVIGLDHWLFGTRGKVFPDAVLLWQVFVIALLVMAVRALAMRKPARLVEIRTVYAAPPPEAEAAFRARLPARLRGAALIAVAAEDHYVRVYSAAGEELLTMRFSQAMEELAQAEGFRVHRSWWVVGGAIRSVRWTRGSGELRLEGGLVVPVSRANAAALKAAGWR